MVLLSAATVDAAVDAIEASISPGDVYPTARSKSLKGALERVHPALGEFYKASAKALRLADTAIQRLDGFPEGHVPASVGESMHAQVRHVNSMISRIHDAHHTVSEWKPDAMDASMLEEVVEEIPKEESRSIIAEILGEHWEGDLDVIKDRCASLHQERHSLESHQMHYTFAPPPSFTSLADKEGYVRGPTTAIDASILSLNPGLGRYLTRDDAAIRVANEVNLWDVRGGEDAPGMKEEERKASRGGLGEDQESIEALMTREVAARIRRAETELQATEAGGGKKRGGVR